MSLNVAMYSGTYEEFLKDYRAYCGSQGRCLDSLPVNLSQLFTLATKHGNVDSSTPSDAWDRVSLSVTGGFLPGRILREQYCTYLEGFAAFAAVVNKENAAPSSTQQQQPKQQSHAPQQLVQSVGQPAPEQPGRPPPQRTKLPKQQIILQELQRRKAAPPAVAPAPQQPVAAAPSPQPAPCSQPVAAAPSIVKLPSLARPPKPVKLAAPPATKLPVQEPAQAAAPTAATLAAPAPAGTRRSGRMRNQAAHFGYVDSGLIPTSSSSSSDSSGSDSGSSSDVDGADSCCTSPSSSSSPWSVDPEFQAVLPHLQSRPATGPTPAEARYLSQPIYTPATPSSSGSRCQQLQSQAPRSSNANPGVALGPGVFHGLWCKAGSGPARVRLLKQWLADMDAHMGQQLSQALGLTLLGSKLRSAWSPHEEILFALGMLDKYRMFRYIKRCYLPRRSVHELNGYYYNVWKNRAGPVAEEFATLNNNPQGDGPAWRQDLCRRLAAMWDHDQFGPVPKLALPDDPPSAGAAAAVKLQAAAVRTSKSKRSSVSRGSSDGAPVTATTAVEVVQAPAVARTAVPVGDFLRFLRQATAEATGTPAVQPLQPMVRAASAAAGASPTQADAAAMLQARHKQRQQRCVSAVLPMKKAPTSLAQQTHQQQRSTPTRPVNQQCSGSMGGHNAATQTIATAGTLGCKRAFATASSSSSGSSSSSSSDGSSSSTDDDEDADGASAPNHKARQGTKTAAGGSSKGAGHHVIADTDGDKQQSSAIGRKRRRSCSEGSLELSPTWMEDDEGVICISD